MLSHLYLKIKKNLEILTCDKNVKKLLLDTTFLYLKLL